jgi:uncharacterized protein (DUF2336 family)
MPAKPTPRSLRRAARRAAADALAKGPTIPSSLAALDGRQPVDTAARLAVAPRKSKGPFHTR